MRETVSQWNPTLPSCADIGVWIRQVEGHLAARVRRPLGPFLGRQPVLGTCQHCANTTALPCRILRAPHSSLGVQPAAPNTSLLFLSFTRPHLSPPPLSLTLPHHFPPLSLSLSLPHLDPSLPPRSGATVRAPDTHPDDVLPGRRGRRPQGEGAARGRYLPYNILQLSPSLLPRLFPPPFPPYTAHTTHAFPPPPCVLASSRH